MPLTLIIHNTPRIDNIGDAPETYNTVTSGVFAAHVTRCFEDIRICIRTYTQYESHTDMRDLEYCLCVMYCPILHIMTWLRSVCNTCNTVISVYVYVYTTKHNTNTIRHT